MLRRCKISKNSNDPFVKVVLSSELVELQLVLSLMERYYGGVDATSNIFWAYDRHHVLDIGLADKVEDNLHP